MTNPNHTDTSRIADLRFQVSEKMPINHSDLSCLFDRIEALEAENERLHSIIKTAWFFTSRLTLIAVGLTIIWSVLP